MNSPDDLAARLDDSLPPGRADLDDYTNDPAVRAAVELARDSRPALSSAARSRIEAQMLAQADHVFARRSATRRRAYAIARRAAAALLIVALAAFLVTTFTHDTSRHATPIASQAAPGVPAPSAPDSVVFVPQDGVSSALTQIGAGSTSIIVQPLTP